ncbi:hypothetical protein C7974DRAFT_2455 [Boeremia exigua]|uniref:uncharacterized protein n=1 Tax=Boeremia exigua TaxID=749465 RepID=UPI001E8EA7E8|nr:uncharacterized protein C7974DRAFT_2455 [Boeremia exigua]KAH6643647.1 hypothetical protein C7974DRAFT_2455 [Boeremia exigua]
MHSIRPRPICRARNALSPANALWQHFVALDQHLPHRPPKSLFATEATQGHHGTAVKPGRESQVVRIVSGESLYRKHTHAREHQQKHEVRTQEQERTRKGKPGHRGDSGQDQQKILSTAQAAYNSLLDYEGVVVRPVACRPWIESKLPWVAPNRDSIKSASDRLNLEIQRFHDFIRPSKDESFARRHVIEQVRQHVQTLLPRYTLEVFGSERTGFAFAGSDIDMRLIPIHVLSQDPRSNLPPSFRERNRRTGDLQFLHKQIVRRRADHYLLSVIRWARYPLISLQDRASGLDIQIVLSNDTSKSREYMQRYVDEYPYLPELYSVIKATLDVRGLTDVYRGGIGSYALFMMIVASLKHKLKQIDDAAGALDNFFRFWSTLNTHERGVSIEPAELFYKTTEAVMPGKAIAEGKVTSLPQWMMSLRDPADKTNDLGRKVVAWNHIRVTFSSILKTLRTNMAHDTRASILAPLVGPTFTLHQQHRQKLSEYGRSLAQACKKPSPTKPSSRTLDELATIARSIRDGHVPVKEPTSKQINHRKTAVDTTHVDIVKDEADGINPWLNDNTEVSDHKETEDAFSNLLGLNQIFEKTKQED